MKGKNNEAIRDRSKHPFLSSKIENKDIIMNALKRLKESKTLPPGHIERKKARQSVDKIYNRCLDIAYKWRKRFRKKYPNVTNAKHALAICHTICDAVGERRIKKIVVNSSDVVLGAAHYYKNEIHFANRLTSVL